MTDQIRSIEGMSDAEIVKATREGKLDALLSGDPYGVEAAKAEVLRLKAEAEAKVNPDLGARGGNETPRYDEAWLQTASLDEIAKATVAGHLKHLLGG